MIDKRELVVNSIFTDIEFINTLTQTLKSLLALSLENWWDDDDNPHPYKSSNDAVAELNNLAKKISSKADSMQSHVHEFVEMNKNFN